MKKVLVVILFSFLLSGCTTISTTQNSPESIAPSQVSLPSGSDAINLFWQLINEKRIPEAIAMISANMVPDDSTKQAYGVQFNDIKSVRVISVEAYGKEEWTSERQTYKTTLEVSVDPTAANLPIPYYGYDSNPNIRFISVAKDKTGLWQIHEIATGP